jgi:hypothetical protein
LPSDGLGPSKTGEPRCHILLSCSQNASNFESKSAYTKIRTLSQLIRILVEDLETAEDIAPLKPFKVYDLPTPYNNFGAGATLMQALESENQP